MERNTKNNKESLIFNPILTVCGYKSLYREQNIELKPFTVLAGANSSGKSSMLQPLLLLKQTLEVQYDPGTLLLDGPNVRFTTFDQLLSRKATKDNKNRFSIQFGNEKKQIKIIYKKSSKDIEIDEMIDYDLKTGNEFIIHQGMSHDEIIKNINKFYSEKSKRISKNISREYYQENCTWYIEKDRCFLYLTLIGHEATPLTYESLRPSSFLEKSILELIHLPGLRGNPERTYKTAAVGNYFPGIFQHYLASIINHWQINKDERLIELGKYMENLGLTWKVEAKQIDDTRVELLVGRLPDSKKANSKDMINIADVGFGVSQVLPVLVSLLIARKGQIVYIEQPELHLHPRAQVALAQIIADAAKRGVCVVIETHSPLLLLGIQTLVAEKKLFPELIKLHWFTREKDGYTKINSVDLDEKGAYGDWPEDFGDIELKLQSRYLDASEDWGN